MMMVSDTLPPNSKHLLHFENSYYDEILQSNWNSYSNIGFTTDSKFGSYALTATGVGGYTYTTLQDLEKLDFTISCWFEATSYISKQLINKADFVPVDESLNRTLSLGLFSDRSVVFYLWGGTNANGSDDQTVVASNLFNLSDYNYLKFGRKDGKMFICLNGVKNETTLPTDYFVNTTGKIFTVGGSQVGSNDGFNGNVDELLVQIGFGDDSLFVPTAPY